MMPITKETRTVLGMEYFGGTVVYVGGGLDMSPLWVFPCARHFIFIDRYLTPRRQQELHHWMMQPVVKPQRGYNVYRLTQRFGRRHVGRDAAVDTTLLTFVYSDVHVPDALRTALQLDQRFVHPAQNPDLALYIRKTDPEMECLDTLGTWVPFAADPQEARVHLVVTSHRLHAAARGPRMDIPTTVLARVSASTLKDIVTASWRGKTVSAHVVHFDGDQEPRDQMTMHLMTQQLYRGTWRPQWFRADGLFDAPAKVHLVGFDEREQPLLDSHGRPLLVCLDLLGRLRLNADKQPFLVSFDGRGRPVLDAEGNPVLDAQSEPLVADKIVRDADVEGGVGEPEAGPPDDDPTYFAVYTRTQSTATALTIHISPSGRPMGKADVMPHIHAR